MPAPVLDPTALTDVQAQTAAAIAQTEAAQKAVTWDLNQLIDAYYYRAAPGDIGTDAQIAQAISNGEVLVDSVVDTITGELGSTEGFEIDRVITLNPITIERDAVINVTYVQPVEVSWNVTVNATVDFQTENTVNRIDWNVDVTHNGEPINDGPGNNGQGGGNANGNGQNKGNKFGKTFVFDAATFDQMLPEFEAAGNEDQLVAMMSAPEPLTV